MSRSTFDDRRIATRFDIGTTFIYIGKADYDPTSGASPADSDPAWTIQRITLTSGSPTSAAWTNAGAGIWTNRATETYN